MQANKGEWSELYAFLFILSARKVPAADKDLNPTNDEYEFLQIIRNDADNNQKIYDLGTPNSVKIIHCDGSSVVVPVSDLPNKTRNIFDQIKAAHDSSFALPNADEIMNQLELDRIKASSSNKHDLEAVVKDKISSRQQLGFSIKSQIGSPATLLNASSHTNFIFKVNGLNEDISNINKIDGRSKIRDRLEQIKLHGGMLEFDHVDSSIFTENLQIIDTYFPVIMSEVLLHYYSGDGSTISELTDILGNSNELRLNEKIINYKIREFLRAIALGMFPGSEWNTRLSAQGGYLVVKNDGALVCYHLYNFDEFGDYLFANTKLDTPSSTRHDFGYIYEDDGQYYMRLNLQIRFIK